MNEDYSSIGYEAISKPQEISRESVFLIFVISIPPTRCDLYNLLIQIFFSNLVLVFKSAIESSPTTTTQAYNILKPPIKKISGVGGYIIEFVNYI
jgi:hypothetical protein